MICCTCKKDKEENEFSFRNKKLNSRNSKCKTCQREYTQKHYAQNKKEYIARAKPNNMERIKKNRKLLLEYLEGKSCVDCGELDIRTLDFDHVDVSNKKDSVTRLVLNGYGWKTIMVEIQKCEIRCANCHRKRTAEQFGTYRCLGLECN